MNKPPHTPQFTTTLLLVGVVLASGCVSPTPAGPDEIPGTPQSGPAYLGDIVLKNKNNVSSTVVIQILQNESVIYQKTRSIPPKTEMERGPIYLDGPNVSGSFIVKVRLEGQSKWKQIKSTSEGLRDGGCFGINVIFRQNGQLDVYPAGRC